MTDENPTPNDMPAAQETDASSPEPKQAETPPWGEDFDAEKAWKLVQNLRSDKERLQQRPVLTDEQKAKLSKYDELVEASQSDLERAQATAQANEQRAQALLARAVKAEAKALASQGFQDPEDAAAFLDLGSYANSDGDVDTERLKADLAGLLERKPHLGKKPETRKPQPNPAQGASANGSSQTQLTKEDVDALMKSGDVDAIHKARVDGRLKNLLG